MNTAHLVAENNNINNLDGSAGAAGSVGAIATFGSGGNGGKGGNAGNAVAMLFNDCFNVLVINNTISNIAGAAGGVGLNSKIIFYFFIIYKNI